MVFSIAPFILHLHQLLMLAQLLNLVNYCLRNAMPVPFALPYRFGFKYAKANPTCDRCIIHAQPFRYFRRGILFLFHTGINVLFMLFSKLSQRLGGV